MSKKYTKYRTLYLPKEIVDCLLLYIYSGIDEFDFNVEIGLNILNDIHTKASLFNKNENYNIIHSPLYSSLLKVKYGDNYVKHKNFMVTNNILWNDISYKGKATHFYLLNIGQYVSNSNRIKTLKELSLDNILSTYSFQYRTEISIVSPVDKGISRCSKNRNSSGFYKIKIPITNKNKKFLTSDYINDSKFINNSVNHIKKMGSHFRNHFKIDFDKALSFIENKYDDELNKAITKEDEQAAYYRYSSRLSSIFLINDGKNNKSLRFNRNKTNRRIDTNLTNMSSDLRQFIVGYEDMVYLDLKNSQPVIFNIILKEHYNKGNLALRLEIDDYFKLTTEGQWYEYLQKLYNNTREESKKLWMLIAYSKNSSYKNEKAVFKNAYPNINKIIESYKTKKHADFAIKLQQIESDVFIDGICRELVNQDIVPFTVHDAIIVNKKDKKQTLEIIESIFKDALGVVPVISEE